MGFSPSLVFNRFKGFLSGPWADAELALPVPSARLKAVCAESSPEIHSIFLKKSFRRLKCILI
jgi:hypothetical protein